MTEHTVVGERVVVPKVGDISLVLFDGEVFDVFVDEVAVTWQVMSGGLLPSVSVLGSYGSGGEPVAFVFVDGGDGRYVLSGVFDQGMQTQVEIRSQGENMVQISEVVPVVDGSSSGVSDAVLVGEDTTTGGEVGGEVGGGVSAFGVESAPRDANGNYVADVLIGYVQDQGISVPDIALSVENANSAYLTSGVKLRLNLFSLVPVTYTQVNDGMDSDIKSLRDGVKGLDVLLKRSEALGADLTSLIVPKASSGVCGRAYYSSGVISARLAVSVVSTTCLSNQTLAHELGHNMGLDHDRGNADKNDPAAYNYGYYSYQVYGNELQFCSYSIMSYDPTGWGGCTKANQFSSPSVDFIGHPGFPSGTASEDNARKLNENAAKIATLRTSHVVGEGFSGTVGWMVSDQGVLTFSSGKFADLDYSSGARPWAEYASVVNKVVFEDPANTSFDRDASYFLWDFKNVTSIDGIGVVDTSSTERMNSMFSEVTSLTILDLSKWDTSKVKVAGAMFRGMTSLVDLKVSTWDTSNFKDMNSMFSGVSSLTDLDISNWDTSSVVGMTYMFSGATNLAKLDLSRWNTPELSATWNMFSGAKSLKTLDLSNFNTSKLVYVEQMFSGAGIETLNLSGWDTSKMASMKLMFSNASISNRLDLSSWDTSSVSSMQGMFNFARIPNLNLSGWDSLNLTDIEYMFYYVEIANLDVSNWTFPKITSIGGMFGEASISNRLDLSSWNTTSITSMNRMFQNARIPSLDLSGWNSPNLTEVGWRFYGARIADIDLSNWTFPKVTRMEDLFGNNQVLTRLDMSNWDTSNVISMDRMFQDTPNLRELSLGKDTALPVEARLGWSSWKAGWSDWNRDNGNRWVNVGGGTVNAPEPTWAGDSSELTARTTIGIADTYVWE